MGSKQIWLFLYSYWPRAAKEIPRPARSFENYVPESNLTMPTGPIFPIKTNKCCGHNEINFNIIRSCFGKLCCFVNFYNICLICPDNLKIAKVTPIFNVKLSPSKKICVICLFESSLKVMKNAFYLI